MAFSLALKYHPDRNPGKELDVVSKFQAVQAAHEILSDPGQKRKYDIDRAKLKPNTPTLPRRGPVPPTPSQFPPPPRRAPTTARGQNPFAGNAHTTRNQPTPSANAEKYGAYARAGAQQWERTKEEAQSRQDAFRGFQQMRPGQSPTRERFAPPPPPRQPRYPTAARPASYVPHSAGAGPTTAPRQQKSWDEFNRTGRFSAGTEASPGFPGLSRTQSTRKKHGFMPTTPDGDEPPAPRSSAYASYSRGERPQASNPQSYFPEGTPHHSPQLNPQRPDKSPLRHATSSGADEERQPRRPGLDRISTRYGGIGGERTDVTSAGHERSSSARNSPVDSMRHEHGSNGPHHFHSHDNETRNRSSSRKSQPSVARANRSISDSETSSEGDSEDETWAARPKAMPRSTHSRPTSTDFGARTTADGQAFTGQFPGTNYVQPHLPREPESSRSQYRSPPPPRSYPTSQAAFNYVPGYSESHPTSQQPTPGTGNGYSGPRVANQGPNMYVPFHFYPWQSSQNSRSSPSRVGKNVPSLNGFPLWAVPSSVLPHKNTPKKHTLDTIREGKRDWIESWRSDACPSTFVERPRKHGRFADPPLSDSSTSDTESTHSAPQPTVQNTSSENGNEKFPAAQWNQTFAAAADIFRPRSTDAPRKTSPVRVTRSRAKSHGKIQTSPTKELQNDFSKSVNDGIRVGPENSETFMPSKFAMEGWTESLRYQTTASGNEGDRSKTPRRPAKTPALKRQPVYPKPGSDPVEAAATDTSASETGQAGTKLDDDVDPMDIDDSSPSSVPSTTSEVRKDTTPAQVATVEEAQPTTTDTNGVRGHEAEVHVNLNDLSKVAPLGPSDTGLGDLRDLNTTLPFESKASPARPSQSMTNGVAFSSLKALNLPKPPKEVIPPLEDLTQEAWTRYTTEMSIYMRDWHIFNKKMLDHFQARQAQLDMTLLPNWVRSLGDGPSGEEISRKIHEYSNASLTPKAGYAAYRQWMEEDTRVREWWNVACERHTQAVIELGKVRERAKRWAA